MAHLLVGAAFLACLLDVQAGLTRPLTDSPVRHAPRRCMAGPEPRSPLHRQFPAVTAAAPVTGARAGNHRPRSRPGHREPSIAEQLPSGTETTARSGSVSTPPSASSSATCTGGNAVAARHAAARASFQANERCEPRGQASNAAHSPWRK